MKKNLSIIAAILLFTGSNAVYATKMQKLTYAHSQLQGKRGNMEDACANIIDLGDNLSFFGLYDGHGGTGAAQAAAHGQLVSQKANPALYNTIYPLHTYIAQGPSTLFRGITHRRSQVRRINLAFAQFERDYLAFGDDAGTTAVVALVDHYSADNEDLLYLAWTGDSRAVLVNTDGIVEYATQDHKIDEPAEAARLKKAGAVISNWGVPRIAGLAMPRALGDRSIKETAKFQAGGNDVIIPTPDIMEFELTTRYAFCILACDGVWDVMSSQEAATLVHDAWQKGLSLDAIAAALTTEAFTRGSTDNISATIIRFDW